MGSAATRTDTGPAATPLRLRGLAWDHPRCVQPMQACSHEWHRRHPGVELKWDVRSLAAFGDELIPEAGGAYDLLFVDHPFCGTAERAGVLRPLDELLTADELAALSRDSIGPSHASYAFHGHQWALATDAACQVSAVRTELLSERPLPTTWHDVLTLAREAAPSVTLPLAPPHAISSFLTLCANTGSPVPLSSERLADPDVGAWAMGVFAELYAHGPAAATRWEPPEVLDRMTSTDDCWYVPLTYGYITYVSPRTVGRPCRFVDIPSSGRGPVGAVLGGAGLAVSATSQHPQEAAEYAAWASSPEGQLIVARSGGQPGSRAVWADPTLDPPTRDFLRDTAASIEHAWMRPREAWWPPFQLEAGRILAGGLEESVGPQAMLRRIEASYADRLQDKDGGS
jgi:multiple sugar transport system substrate-binding protein